MKPSNRYIIFRLSLAFGGGIVSTYYWPWLIQGSTIGLTLCLILLSGLYLATPGFRIRLIFELLALVAFLFLGGQSLNHSLLSNGSEAMEKHLRFGELQLTEIQLTDALKPGAYNRSYVAAIRSIDRQEAIGKVLLRTSLSDSLIFRPGQRLVLYGEFERLKPGMNPGQFDSQTYWAGKQVHFQLRIKPDQLLGLFNSRKTWSDRAYFLRKSIVHKLKLTPLGKDQLAITLAMLLGDRTHVDGELRSSFQKAGAMHLLAISGLHVGIIFAIFNLLSYPIRYLPYGKLLQSIIIIIGISAFAWLTGFTASVSRASLLVILYSILRLIGRSSDSTHMLSSVFLGLLVFNPLWIFDIGFQLSFTAVLAIIWLSPPLNKLLKTNWGALKWLRGLLVVSFTAQLGVLPLSLYYFHQFSGSFWLSSLLVLPIMGIVLLLGLTIILLAVLEVDLVFLVEPYNELLGYILDLLTVIGQTGYWKEDIAFSFRLCLISILLLISLTAWIYLKNAISRRTTLILLLLSVTIGWKDGRHRGSEKFYLLHQIGETVMAQGKQEKLTWMGSNSNLSLANSRVVRDLKRVGRYTKVRKRRFTYLSDWQGKKLLIIDSVGVYPLDHFYDWVLLTQNPKINLQRLIDSIQPELIMADGTNWPSNARFWAKTCQKNKLRFHYTGESGALVLSMD